jgi:hypothetical protein
MIENIGSVKNPLTIIAIFAGIAEISGTAVLPFINPELQFIFIWYVIFFPILLNILFFITANFNHHALFGPTDYRDDKYFVQLQKEKGSKELKEHIKKLNHQLNSADTFLSEMQNMKGIHESSFYAARNQFNKLSSELAEIQNSLKEGLSPDPENIISSAMTSDSLAITTSSVSPVAKEDIIKILNSMALKTGYKKIEGTNMYRTDYRDNIIARNEQKVVLDLIKNYKNGVTIPTIAEQTGYDEHLVSLITGDLLKDGKVKKEWLENDYYGTKGRYFPL